MKLISIDVLELLLVFFLVELYELHTKIFCQETAGYPVWLCASVENHADIELIVIVSRYLHVSAFEVLRVGQLVLS